MPTADPPPVPQVFDSGSDAIAVHAVSVLTAIVSNSPSAKVGMGGGCPQAQMGFGFFTPKKCLGVMQLVLGLL